MPESFDIEYKQENTREVIHFSAVERKLVYRREQKNLISIDIEFLDGYQKFVTSVSDFLCNAVPSQNEEKAGFRISSGKDSNYYEFSEKWMACAKVLVEILNEYTLFSGLTDPVFFNA